MRGLIGVSIARAEGKFVLLQLAFWSIFGRQVCNFAFCTREDRLTTRGKFVFDIPRESAPFVPSRAGCTQTRNFLQDSPRNIKINCLSQQPQERAKIKLCMFLDRSQDRPREVMTFCMFLGSSKRKFIFACSLRPAERKFRVLILPHGLVQKEPIHGEYQIQTCLSQSTSLFWYKSKITNLPSKS